MEAGLNDPLIFVRAIHFAATLSAAGVAFFIVLIAEPAFRSSGKDLRLPTILQNRLAVLAWSSLVLAVLSGAAWLLLVAAEMSDQPLPAVFSSGVVGTVLTQTGFGQAWLDRFVCACLLALAFALMLPARRRSAGWVKALAVVSAAAFAGVLAWSGHAVGGRGLAAVVHPTADVLHLIAAAAWVGGLVPLMLMLAAALPDAESIAVAQHAVVRFSALGIAGVVTLLATGIINTGYLVGSFPALVGTDYGRLLLAKIALFFVMVAIAAVNRLRLMPQLLRAATPAGGLEALRRLRRNAVMEVSAGAVIIGVVSVLGTQPPAIHQMHMSPGASMNHHVH
jgi:copper resistance protein D